MKNSKAKTVLTLIFILGLATFYSGCDKINDLITPDKEDSVNSTTGEATVGTAGGTISVGDESSPIYGANIEIPADALDEDVNIQIVAGDKVEINGEMVQTVKFQPDGQQFKDQVIIGVPWSTDNQEADNSKIYFYDEANTEIVQLVNDHVDVQNKITYAYVNHFSKYFNNPQFFWIESKLMKRGDIFYANMNMHTPMMYVKPLDPSSFYANAQEIILDNEGSENCFVRLRYILWHRHRIRKYYIQGLAYQDFYIKFAKVNDSWDITIYRYDNPFITTNQPEEIFHKSGMSFEQMTDDWFTGFPVTAEFNENCFWNHLDFFDDDLFEVSCSWSLARKFVPVFRNDFWTMGKSVFSGLKPASEINSYNGDYNNNNIEDNFENGNNAPSKPNNPQPADNATGVTLNSTLQWSCNDADGDALTYKIYLGEEYNTTLVGTTDNITSFTPTGLGYGHTYYWYVEATDPSGATSTGDTWSFTTKEAGGNTGCNGVTTVEYEGKTYHTVEIGNQCWMKENLNVGTMINSTTSQTDNGTIEKYCYGDNVANCDQYGGFYQWNELMQYVEYESARGVCPEGWHVPSKAEWYILEGNADSQYGVGDEIWEYGGWRGFDAGKKLKATSGWFMNNNGTDDFGFAALPGGKFNSSNGHFTDNLVGGWFWTSSGRMHGFAYNNDKVYSSSEIYDDAFPVRCVKD